MQIIFNLNIVKKSNSSHSILINLHWQKGMSVPGAFVIIAKIFEIIIFTVDKNREK